jgi:hypothetical protein
VKALVSAVLTALMSLAVSNVAMALTQSGSSPTITRSSRLMPVVPQLASPEAEARAALRRLALCHIIKYPNVVAAAITKRVAIGAAALARIGSEFCAVYAIQVGGTLRSPDWVMFGMYFGELYRQHQSLPSGSEWSFPLPSLHLAGTQPTESNLDVQTYFAMLKISECVFIRNPEIVRSIVISSPGSAEQNQAFALIAPYLGACVPQGQNIRFSRSVIESSFGEFLYKSLAQAAMTTSKVAE